MLIMYKPKYRQYNRTNTCDKCGKELVTGDTLRVHDKDENWTGIWCCFKCWKKYDPNSNNNIIKSMADRRTGNIDYNCAVAKGDLFEELTCVWKGVKILSKENDRYNGPLDHSRDLTLGLVYQTKGKLYDHIDKSWKQSWKNEHNKEFDYLISYCTSKDGKIIERIYIFPKEEVVKRSGITIVKNPSRGVQWYEKYRIKDENIINNGKEILKEK